MLTRRAALTALVGAAIGVLVLGIIFATAKSWYATSASPLVLILTPGALLAMLSPNDPYWWVLLVVGQAASYGIAALAIVAIIDRAKLGRKDAV